MPTLAFVIVAATLMHGTMVIFHVGLGENIHLNHPEFYAAVQRISDLVNRGGTRQKTAWDMSLWSRENDLRSATSRLRDAMKIIRKLLGH